MQVILAHQFFYLPVITLLSDLGTQDASVATAKATLWRYVPDAVITDMSHRTELYDLQQAAYLLLSAYAYFPKGTIHVVLADVFAGEKPRMLVGEKDGYFFIAPDNGILSLAFAEGMERIRFCREFEQPHRFSDWIQTAGKVMAALQDENSGEITFSDCDVKKVPRLLQPKVMPDGVDCNVLYIDRYENIVLDMTRVQFDEIVRNRPFRIKIMRKDDIVAVSNNYNEVPVGEPLCRFNTAGFLEIAFNHGQAANSLGLESFSAVNLRYQTIKLFF